MPDTEHEEAPFRELVLAGGAARAVLRREHAWRLCAGHFPDEPLLPGAVLAGLMADLAAHLVEGELAEVVRCVFRRRVTPADEIVLAARIDAAAGGDTRVEAEVQVRGRSVARATLRFAPRP